MIIIQVRNIGSPYKKYYIIYIKNIINNIIKYCNGDSFKNFVDFQNPFCDCHSK